MMGVETSRVKRSLRDNGRAGPEMATLETHAKGAIFFSTIKSGTPITFRFFRHVSKPSANELFLKLRAVFIVLANSVPSKMNSFYPNYKFLTTGWDEILFQSSQVLRKDHHLPVEKKIPANTSAEPAPVGQVSRSPRNIMAIAAANTGSR